PLDLRDDQPEPGRREASGRRRPAVAHGAGRGQAERGAARSLAPNPRADQGGPRVCDRASGSRRADCCPPVGGRRAAGYLTTSHAAWPICARRGARRGPPRQNLIAGAPPWCDEFGPRSGSVPRMTPLQDLLETAVESGTLPGAAALVARGEDVEIAGVGEVEPDLIVWLASITKPITAAAIMILVDDGLVSLDDPIARWLPELSSPRVVRTPQSPIDDVVPACARSPSRTS